MSNRYWVGNSGVDNDTAHWSTTSGGPGGASVPFVVEDVILDANSFSLPGQTITCVTGIDCRSFNSATVTNSPTLDFPNIGISLVIRNSSNFTGVQFSGAGLFAASFPAGITMSVFSAGITLTTGGTLLPSLSITNGNGRTLTLVDALAFIQTPDVALTFNLTGTFTFTTAANNITALNLLAFSSGAATLNFDNSTIIVNSVYYIGSGITVSSTGTTWQLNGTVSTSGSTLSSPTSATISSPDGVSVYHTTVNNITATSTSGALSRIIIDPGEDPGHGGGSPPGPNPGWRVITRRFGTPTHFT